MRDNHNSISLKYRWKFQKEQIIEHKIPDTCEVDHFHDIVIPHDWLIENTNDLYENSVGWYRRILVIKNQSSKRRFLRFEGIYMDSTIYVNGIRAMEWKYGYTTFEFEITELIHEGENEILVKVVHQSPNSRWYTGAGILRPVWLIEKEKVHFISDGIYIHTEREDSIYHTMITAEIDVPKQMQDLNMQIKYSIYNMDNQLVQTAEFPADQFPKDIQVNQAREWSIDTPYLYKLQAQLIIGGVVTDEEWIRFGYRTIEFTSDHGFMLNGKHVKLQGACLHHDLGCLGGITNTSAIRRQFQIMKEMGVNALRTAHNMPSVEFMMLADDMGFLVMSEAFDCWKHSKTEYDYGRFFETNAEKDVRNWIRRDRNHPSVFMWSVGNEIYDMHADESGQETLKKLMSVVTTSDPMGNARVTFGSNFLPWENTQKCADIIKLTGYNYSEKLYEKHHREHPDWIIYGSETSSIVQSRGIYHFPKSREILAEDDMQCSSLGNSITSWGAASIESCILNDRKCEYSLGQFIWSGIDYIGEPTPYQTRNSYFGQVDTAGFPKDSYYMYQAAWTSADSTPFVHIFPYWDFNVGQMIDVSVCSNLKTVELYLNDKSLGKKEIDSIHDNKLTADWKIPYEDGELHALAYDEAGNIAAKDTRKSFSDADYLVLEADRYEINADDEELVFITISTLDQKGRPVENANNRIFVEVSGEGVLAGLDNGDSTDIDKYHTNSKRMFSGKLLAVIRSNGRSGIIEVTAHSKGLHEDRVVITSVQQKKDNGNNNPMYITENMIENVTGETEIPIRKIELKTEKSRILTPNHRVIEVRANFLPQNADPQVFTWRVTDEAGVDCPYATIKWDSQNATIASVSAKGDGKFQIRCMCKNGKNHESLLSILEGSAEGFGTLNLNPYHFLSASLFTSKGGAIGNGNERGISSSRDGASWIAFENMDFGDFGSDEVTIPIFSFGGEVQLVFWEGIPHQPGSTIAGNCVYTKPSVWNTYIPDTFHLDYQLRGITTFAIELTTKIHIKGLSFTKQYKAYAHLHAAEADKVYGDSYVTEGKSILGIGNNVTLVYDDMDFTDKTCTAITVTGYTPNKKNTIQIVCETDETRTQEVIEFPHTEKVESILFPLIPKNKKMRVSFLFLPGCNFDFESFQFEPERK